MGISEVERTRSLKPESGDCELFGTYMQGDE